MTASKKYKSKSHKTVKPSLITFTSFKINTKLAKKIVSLHTLKKIPENNAAKSVAQSSPILHSNFMETFIKTNFLHNQNSKKLKNESFDYHVFIHSHLLIASFLNSKLYFR